MKQLIAILLICILGISVSSCKKKKEEEKDRFLFGQIVDSSYVPIANTSFVLYTIHTPSGVMDKGKYYPFSFTTDKEGNFRAMFNLSGDVSLIKILYPDEAPDGGYKELYSAGSLKSNTEINAGVIVARRK